MKCIINKITIPIISVRLKYPSSNVCTPTIIWWYSNRWLIQHSMRKFFIRFSEKNMLNDCELYVCENEHLCEQFQKSNNIFGSWDSVWINIQFQWKCALVIYIFVARKLMDLKQNLKIFTLFFPIWINVFCFNRHRFINIY